LKALVTGASGFTGSHLCRYLLQRRYQIRGLVRRSSSLARLQHLPIELACGDLGDDSPLDTAVQGVDVVYHIAALFRAEGIPRKTYWDVNVGGTMKLLEAARRAGVRRFIHCSTVGVQGSITKPPAREADPYAPGDYYQKSKRDGELAALAFSEKHGLPLTVVRPAGIYGPGDTRFLKLFRMINSGRFHMIGSGKVYYHFTYIDDLVRGIALAGDSDQAIGEIFTVAGSDYVTLSELAEIVATALGKSPPHQILRIPVWPIWLAGAICEFACRPLGIHPPLYRRRVDFFIKNRAFDISKARRILGYEPHVSLAEGMNRTAQWYLRQGLLE
jgi:nucleoside-diphosphate-sugar epimerase